jgi:hypothetical protein
LTVLTIGPIGINVCVCNKMDPAIVVLVDGASEALGRNCPQDFAHFVFPPVSFPIVIAKGDVSTTLNPGC